MNQQWYKWAVLVVTPLLLSPLPLLIQTAAARCAAVVLLMAAYWTLEILPLPVTALLPVILYPLLGILSTNETAAIYMKGSQMMYFGSLMVALAVEESNLHRRVALRALLLTGTAPSLLMMGFMIPTAFLSMWISNTASTAMMVPILEALLVNIDLTKPQKTMMMLSVAYSANMGGTGTVIGSPGNIIFMEFLSDFEDQPLNFSSWMLFCVPLMIVNIVLVWITMQLFFLKLADIKNMFGKPKQDDEISEVLQKKYDDLGPVSFHEKAVLGVFSGLVVLWFFRKPGFMPGWGEALQWTNSSGNVVAIGSATETILMSLLLFIIPANPWKDPGGKTLLQWKTVQSKLPWGILFLMGGGFALAEGAKASCLAHHISSSLEQLSSLPRPLILLVVCLASSGVSQIASNSATVAIMLPVIISLARSTMINPIYLMMGATMAASNAFMLPVSTPPNAIVFAAGHIRVKDMLGIGLVLNVVCIGTLFLCLHSYGVPLFDLNQFPDWAASGNITSVQCS